MTKTPKTVKLAWGNSQSVASSPRARFVVAAGELGKLCRIDVDTWKAAPLRQLGGSATSLAVLEDRFAVGVATHEGAYVEIRGIDDGTVATIDSRRNARVAWSPRGDLLVATIEEDVKHQYTELAFVDPAAGSLRVVDVGSVDSIAAAFHPDGETVLAFVRKKDADSREGHHILKISRRGRVEDLGATDCWSAFRRLVPIRDRFLLLSYSEPWRLVDHDGRTVVKGGNASCLCVDGDGFAVAFGSEVTRFSADGTKRSFTKAKKRADSLARGGDQLLVLQSGQVEIM